MQRFLLRKIELWSLLLVAILGFLGLIIFGSVVLETERGNARFGVTGRAMVGLANLPRTVREIIKGKDPRWALRTGDLEGKSGWHLADGVTGLPSDGYLLLSRYDGTRGSATVELLDLADFSLRYSWQPDADQLFGDVTPVPGEDMGWNRTYFEAVHPYVLADGSLIIKDNETPLFRVDHCARRVWVEQTHLYHHSVNMDGDGNLWVPMHFFPPKPENGPGFRDNGLAQVSPDGKLLQVLSLQEIFARNDLTAEMFTAGSYQKDPLHVNDIQPVLTDGPYWKKGDLFLSLRHRSMIALYRPATGKIIWSKEGPWLAQHDVDILDDHRISVFNNNAIDRGTGAIVDGFSEPVIYDFATGQVTQPIHQAMADNDVATLNEGLVDYTPSGNLVVEEENSGRLLIVSAQGKILADYVNRAADGHVYTTSWVRMIDRAYGDKVLAAIKAAPACQ